MAYQWADQATIQAYLSDAGNLTIGADGQILPETAEVFENDSVFEIRTILSAAWTGLRSLDKTNTPSDLKRLVSKLAASRLGGLEISGRIGESPQWIERYRSEVIAQCQRLVINFSTVDLFEGIDTVAIREGITVAELLLLVKVREFAPEPPA